MIFRYLGTAAAEGIPAIFCECSNCKKARLIGGRAMRTRPQALIDGKLLIDFGADTLAHFHQFGIDSSFIRTCIITHSHSDHFYPAELGMLRPGFSNMNSGWKLDFYGSCEVISMALESRPEAVACLESQNVASFNTVNAYETFESAGYVITPLPGLHDPASGPLIYVITDGNKTVLYAHDTHFFPDEVWEYFNTQKPHFDLVSLDCCEALSTVNYIGHMSLKENKEIRRRFLEEGFADENTRFIANHFSHNGRGSVYDDFVVPAAKCGIEVSYDGMIVEL